MSEKKEKLETLRFVSQQQINLPARIDMSDGMLTWTWDPASRNIDCSPRPLEGCLEAFVSLADASCQQVLDFARVWGVLGVNPLVREEGARVPSLLVDWYGPEYKYKEHYSVYRQIAELFRAVLEVMKALQAGRRVNEQMMSPLLIHSPSVTGLPWAPMEVLDLRGNTQAHMYLLRMASWLWRSSSIHLKLAGLEEDERGLHMSGQPKFALRFKEWSEGKQWDIRESKRSRRGGLITPPPEIVKLLDALPKEARLKEAERQGYCPWFGESPLGEWVKTYGPEPVTYKEIENRRPGGLLDPLAFQLLGRIVIPDGTCICSHCNKMYAYVEAKARKPKRGEDPAEFGMSKPRAGRETAFCSQECRRQDDADEHKRRYRTRKGTGSTQ